MPIRTRIIDVDEVLRCARTIEVFIGSKTFVTPRRVLAACRPRYYNEAALKNREVRGFVEVYRHVDREGLSRAMSDQLYASRLNYEVSSLLKRAEGDIMIGLMEYNAGGRRPEKVEAEHLFHLLNNPSLDILVPPIIPRMPCEEYIRFLDEFVEIHRSCSFHATLVPLIPHYSIVDVAKLFDYYARKDQISKSFLCVDFNGSNPISQYAFVSKVVREARRLEKEYGEASLLYAINLKYGKATRKQRVVPAKDVTIFAMGFSLFGPNHKMLPILGGIGDYDLSTKVFNRADYGYYSLEMAERSMSEAGDFEVKLTDVLKDGRLAKVFNAERHGLEALEISRAINEGSLAKYIRSKPKIAEDEKTLKNISKVNEAASEESLSKYF
jgi:hypothetical protein